MKHIYFQVFDISKDPNSIEYAYFGNQPINSDLAGWVRTMAYTNNSSVDYIRLFIYETKQSWEKAQEDWVSRIAKTNNRK